MSIITLMIAFFICLLLGVPFGVISFVLMHKTYGVRKAIILIFTIVYFILAGLGFIILFAGSFSILSLYFFIFSLPFVITSFILVVTRPGNFSPKQPNLAKQNLAYIEELERLKKLLDCGAITKEEYDTKKSEILNRK